MKERILTEEQTQRRRDSRRKWRNKNPDYTSKYKAEHLDHCKEVEMAYREAHKDDKREYDRVYRETNKERISSRKKSYHVHRSSAHKRVYDDCIGEWVCAICGVSDGVQLDVHHKNQCRDDNSPENLVCLCKNCHQALHRRWQNVVIPTLINNNLVDWQGNIILEEKTNG